MTGPKISEDFRYCLRRKSVKCKYVIMGVLIQTKLDQILEGNSGRILVLKLLWKWLILN